MGYSVGSLCVPAISRVDRSGSRTRPLEGVGRAAEQRTHVFNHYHCANSAGERFHSNSCVGVGSLCTRPIEYGRVSCSKCRQHIEQSSKYSLYCVWVVAGCVLCVRRRIAALVCRGHRPHFSAGRARAALSRGHPRRLILLCPPPVSHRNQATGTASAPLKPTRASGRRKATRAHVIQRAGCGRAVPRRAARHVQQQMLR